MIGPLTRDTTMPQRPASARRSARAGRRRRYAAAPRARREGRVPPGAGVARVRRGARHSPELSQAAPVRWCV